MSTLKEKFDNYRPLPDSDVWQGISSSLNHRVVRRRWLTASSAVAIGAGAFAFFFALNNGSDTINSVDKDAVVVAENNMVIAPSISEVTTEPSYLSSHDNDKDKSYVSTSETSKPSSSEILVTEPKITADEVEVVQVISKPAVVEDNVTSESKTVTEPVAKLSQVVATETKTDDEVVAPEPQRRVNPKAPPAELAVWIPNAFSPDDPVEESARIFKVFPNNDANIRTFEIFIYSRGGRLVYHSRDVNQGWDGTANGHPQPMGTYVYVIELNDAVKGLQHKKGTITLIR